jgi:hypothetical protein
MVNASKCPGLACALVVSCAAALHAATVEPASDLELVAEAGFIVHGRVVSAVSEWNADETQIFTYVDIAVDRQLKGAPLGPVVNLRVLGGWAGGIGMSIAEAPNFALDEEVVVLLNANPHGIMPVTGMSAGKFTVETDAVTGAKTVRERGVALDPFLARMAALGQGIVPGRRLPGPQAPREQGGAVAGQDPACPNPDIDCCTGAGPGGVGCHDNDCCNEVCDLDPFCCDVAWDSICTGEAQAVCPELCAPPPPGPADDSTSYRFRVSGVGGTATPIAGPPLAPHAPPPFLHFDLREFVGCEVPYSFFNGTADLPGTTEFDAIVEAFNTWEAVTPSILGFDLRLPGPGAACPLIKDKHNMIGWNTGACTGAGDDVCLVPAGNDDVAAVALVCGGAVAANAVLINAGVDGILQASANNCLGPICKGDDVELPVVGPTMIQDGGNGIIESVLVDRGCDCHFRLAAQVEIVGPGPDGWLTTEPNNCCDDIIKVGVRDGQVFFGIWDGGNGIRETIAVPPDMNYEDQSTPQDNVDCYCKCLPNQLLVIFTSQIATPPNNCCDDAVVNVAAPNNPPVYRIKDGGDLRVTTRPGLGLAKRTLALAANFYEGPREGGPNSGRILESDILFNDFYTWQILANNVAMGGNPDVESVALHEIGHFIGLHHAANLGVSNPDPVLNPGGIPIVMNPTLDTTGKSLQVLHPGDEAGINFQYTPDLGDAPDPIAGVFNEYQTLVHSVTPNPGRTLNGLQLNKPGAGPVHTFGHGTGAPGADVPRFEWLGADEDGHQDECEAFVPDDDDHDDGVTLVDEDGDPVTRITRGADNYFEVVVSHTKWAGRYVNAANQPRRRLYVNGYLDLDGDDVFDTGDPGPSDLEMWWAGVPDPCTTFNAIALDGGPVCDNDADPKTITLTFKVAIPAGAPDTIHARFRVDWGEDLGYTLPDGVSGDLLDGEGAAQFGEVEDYAFQANGGKALCPGDCAQPPSGSVDTVDFLALLQVWGLAGGNGPCDFDDNGIVDTVDFLFLLQNWGPC